MTPGPVMRRLTAWARGDQAVSRMLGSRIAVALHVSGDEEDDLQDGRTAPLRH